MLKKNDCHDTVITGTTSEGYGVARIEGRAVFVPRAIEGERCRVKLVKVGAQAVYGRLEAVLDPSPHRAEPDCPWYGRCGGCAFRHMDYELESRLKAARVAETLRRIGGLDPGAVPITPGEHPEGYRNKAVYPVRQGESGPEIGFFRARTHEIVPVAHCRIQHPAADAAREATLEWMREKHIPGYDERSGGGCVRSLFVRTAADGRAMVCLAAACEKLPEAEALVQRLRERVPQLETVLFSPHLRPGNAVLGKTCRTLWGPGYLEDTLAGSRFRLSPLSFYQVNHDQAERLYARALALAELTGRETVLDLYCGAGTITLLLARHARRAVGVEVVPEAIADAQENARRNGVTNAEFYCEDAAAAACRFADAGERPDVIVVDPPRKGLAEAVVAAIAQMAPPRLVYVSCDPATLARDCARLTEAGYQLRSAEAFDLFPRCAHVESAVLLIRRAQTGIPEQESPGHVCSPGEMGAR